MDNNLAKYSELVFKSAFYKTGNYHTAEDITSQTLALYCLKNNDIEHDNIKGWLLKTADNYCKKFFEKQKKKIGNFNSFIDFKEECISNDLEIEQNKSLRAAFEDALTILDDHEMQTIMLFYQSNQNIKDMLDVTGKTYAAQRKQLSRIKKKLKAKTYLNLGFFGSKRIVTPQLDNLIYQFLQRYKENLENDTLPKMHYYFSKIDIQKYKQDIHIKRIIEYDIELHESIYKVWAIYENQQDQAESCYIEFYIDEKNHLKILTPPTQPKKVVAINADSYLGKKISELINSYPLNKAGHPKIPKGEIEKIIKQFKEKQVDQSRK
jgi:RNA polymerase sigma factor (sigma-70 family)